MTTDEARDVIFAVFKAAWDGTGFPATYSDVPGSVPASETVWARVTLRHTSRRQSSLLGGLGVKRYTARGFVWVQIFAPVGDGSVAGYTAAQTVLNAFTDASTAVLFRDVVATEAGNEGAFERFDVKAFFEYDDVR